jgi:hypothetical protein
VSEFKPLSREAIPAALEKAHRYRLLNEPAQAESICDDILAIDPENQTVLVTLLLALTDQFHGGPVECFSQAESIVPQLNSEYEQRYYRGIICERRGYALIQQGSLGGRTAAGQWIRQAMEFYEQAEPLRPAGNDDAILRWNSCLRLRQRYQLPDEPESSEPILGDE